jgi:MFS family permease
LRGTPEHPPAAEAGAAAEPARSPAGLASVGRLLRDRHFATFLAGNALSATGTWFQNLAAALLVYRLTHSALLLGVLNFSQFAAVIVLLPWTAAAADRFDRRLLLLWTQTSGALLAGALALLARLGAASTGVVIAFALGLGVASAFSAPVQQALASQLVPREELASAVALNSLTFNLARAVGPALGGISVATLGIAASFAINALSYVVFALALLTIRPSPQRRAARGETRLRESLRLVAGNPRLALLLTIVAVVGFASDPVNTLSPAWAHAFHRRDTLAGVIVAAFSTGAIAAALVVAGRAAGSRRRMVGTLLVLGAGMVGFSLVPWFPLALVLLAAAGFGYLASNTHANARLQLEVEEDQRGRILALWSVAFLGLRPIASLSDGAIASAVGVRAAGVVLALPALVVAAIVYRRWRRLGNRPG